ncbi:LPXTG cell wall anchor domain-containing protein [Rathayibacter sp. VKM Ac-2760]|uniref:LPXTG cell wall anchor domain-containing protein n=1 Tax=Rathayibacter sp. VKM Ac-2760 TaxID=2609253 RepID=UPI001316CC07|nr:LPXTG cell wall anchor domain-containing protein [Rathayibacter sp. VKM Ac-2760]QHC57494.1 LPXTG cell wall anchor domain-containing protein [Rathayibacter sp. VKM Ac-2760]
MPPHHQRPQSQRPQHQRPQSSRRGLGVPCTVAASLALTVGLLGAASAAHAVEPGAPAAAQSTPAADAAAPSVSVTFSAEFTWRTNEPLDSTGPVSMTVRFANTGSVPFLSGGTPATEGAFTVAPGETRSFSFHVASVSELLSKLSSLASIAAPTSATASPAATSTPATASAPAAAAAAAAAGTDAPTVRVEFTGDFTVTSTGAPKAGTVPTFTVTLTNIGTTPVVDAAVPGTSDSFTLAPGETKTFTFGIDSAGDLVSATVPPAPEPQPSPAPATPTPSEPTATPSSPAVADGPTDPAQTVAAAESAPAPAGSTAPAASTASAPTTSYARNVSSTRLAETGPDTAGAVPAAGILALLGSLGVFLGRRRTRTAD